MFKSKQTTLKVFLRGSCAFSHRWFSWYRLSSTDDNVAVGYAHRAVEKKVNKGKACVYLPQRRPLWSSNIGPIDCVVRPSVDVSRKE